jgi:hypothetical protein
MRSGIRRRDVGLGGHHVPALARERIARLFSGPAAAGRSCSAVRYAASWRRRGAEAKLDLGSLDALLWSGLLMSDAPSITDTLTHPTITNQTSPHFAEALGSGQGSVKVP